jgi:hypothetical protein
MRLAGRFVDLNRKRVVSLLESTGREGIDALVKRLHETDFFTAPASTRPDYHGCYAGGLARHSLNVYDSFRPKVDAYSLDIRSDEAIIASICHDLCKIGIYVPNRLKSGALSESKPYVVEDDFPFGHGEKSVLIASRDILLTKNESLLMRWHMGPYDGDWEDYEDKIAKACPAIYAFHASDVEASRYLDNRER